MCSGAEAGEDVDVDPALSVLGLVEGGRAFVFGLEEHHGPPGERCDVHACLRRKGPRRTLGRLADHPPMAITLAHPRGDHRRRDQSFARRPHEPANTGRPAGAGAHVLRDCMWRPCSCSPCSWSPRTGRLTACAWCDDRCLGRASLGRVLAGPRHDRSVAGSSPVGPTMACEPAARSRTCGAPPVRGRGRVGFDTEGLHSRRPCAVRSRTRTTNGLLHAVE